MAQIRRLLYGYQYEEQELWEMFTDAEIGYLDIATHISPEVTDDYREYCENNGLGQSENSAETFLEIREAILLDQMML